ARWRTRWCPWSIGGVRAEGSGRDGRRHRLFCRPARNPENSRRCRNRALLCLSRRRRDMSGTDVIPSTGDVRMLTETDAPGGGQRTDEDLGRDLAERVIEIRRERGLSLRKLALMSGIPLSTLSKVQNNRATLTYPHLVRL